MKRIDLLLVCAVAAIAGCGRPPVPVAKPMAPAPRLTIVTDRPTLESLPTLPSERARLVRPDVFRLRPDRRFLIALGELDRFVRGDLAVRLRLSWIDGAWRIESARGVVATAAEVSGYGDLRRILTDRARALLAEPPAPGAAKPRVVESAALRRSCDGFDPGAIIDALQKQQWALGAPPDGEMAALGARAFTLLTVQSLDTLEMADLLRARALALLALAEAEGRPPDAGMEALLAFSLGYAADAVRAAGGLPADDPVRLYVTEQTAALVAAAEREGAAPLTRYLALLSLAAKGDRRTWGAFEEKQFSAQGFSLPVLRAAAALHSFEMNASIGNATLYATLDAFPGSHPATPIPKEVSPDGPREWSDALIGQFVETVRHRLKLDQAALVRNFESGVGGACGTPTGTLWDSDVCRAWYRGFFYSGLYALGHSYLDELSDPGSTQQFAAYLQGSPPGPGAQFARWYADMSSVLSGQAPGQAQFDDLATLTWFGQPVVERTATTVVYQQWDAGGRDPFPEIGARIAQRLDGRPAHLDYMTQVAAEPLLDLPMVERLCRNWMDLGARTEHSWAVRCAGILAGPADLEKLIARRDLDMASRADALAQYCDLPGAVERVCRAGFRALAEESGYDRIVTRPWMLHLDKRRDYAEIQRAAEGWLAHHDPSFGLMWHVYRGRLAHGMAMQGRNAEAWKIIEPELSTGQGSILLWGSQILARMGRTDEALQLGRASVQRYPDGYEQRAVLAELLWRADRDSEAALALEPPEPAYRVYEGVWMEDVAPRFADVFRGKSDERVEAAMRTLQAQGIYSRKLSRLVPPLAAAGRNELAFRLLMSFPQKHLHWWDIAGYDKDAFAYLEKAQGRAAATAWLQKAVVPAEREALLEAFFDHRAYAFLWDGVPAGEDARLSEWLWLLRAGAVAADPAIAAAHRKDVAEHFRDPMPNDPTRTLARFLLGMEDREAAARAATTPVDRCKAAYFFGLGEVASGRYPQASDWYLTAFDGCTKAAWRMSYFSRTTLRRWSTEGHTLRGVEAAKIR